MCRLISSALTFRKAGVVLAALIVSSVAANAADMSKPIYKAPAYAPPPFTWTGPYVGIVGGGSFGDLSGYNVGGTLGYNWQMGAFVYGIEGDISYTSNDGTISGTSMSQDYMMTVRGRFGWAFTPRMLVYGTGGYAGSNLKATAPGLTEEKFRNGWTLGAGVEYALLPQWTVKAEYLYVDYGDQNYFQGTAFSRSLSNTDSLFRVGMNYKF